MHAPYSNRIQINNVNWGLCLFQVRARTVRIKKGSCDRFCRITSRRPFSFIKELSSVFRHRVLTNVRLFRRFPCVHLRKEYGSNDLCVTRFNQSNGTRGSGLCGQRTCRCRRNAPITRSVIGFFSSGDSGLFRNYSIYI